jgi:hypothetical protein
VRITRLGPVAVLAVAVVLLSGCGAAQPGVAAEVGQETITVDEVDELAANICSVTEDLPDDSPNAGVRTGEQARNSALQALILRSMADQMAADYGVESGEDFRRQEDRARLGFAGSDEAKVEAALPGVTAIAYFVDILQQIGDTTESGLSDDEALTTGIGLAQDWQAENGVETNPVFRSFSIGDQEIEAERSDLSFAASGTAKDAEAGSQEYASSLPESQRCG